LWSEGCAVVAGTDEAGRGPLAGPVVSAAFAVLAREDTEVRELLNRVHDSKAMTPAQRDEAYERLTDPKLAGRVAWSIRESSVPEIDKHNILQASLSSMASAVCSLEPRPDCVLVDGSCRPPGLLAVGEGWTQGRKQRPAVEWTPAGRQRRRSQKASKVVAEGSKPAASDGWLPKRVEAVVNGDALVPSISAASVLAKVHRDRIMVKMHKSYPQYGFDSHKGYGTKLHLDMIKKHGVKKVHRKSFAPVRKVLASLCKGKVKGSGVGASKSRVIPGKGRERRNEKSIA